MIDSKISCQWLDSESKGWQTGYINYESGHLREAVAKYMEKKKCDIVVVTHPSGATKCFKSPSIVLQKSTNERH